MASTEQINAKYWRVYDERQKISRRNDFTLQAENTSGCDYTGSATGADVDVSNSNLCIQKEVISN